MSCRWQHSTDRQLLSLRARGPGKLRVAWVVGDHHRLGTACNSLHPFSWYLTF